MKIEVLPVTINFEECFKLRLDGTLFGVFSSHDEAIQYSENLKFNLPGDLSDPKNP
jgi:hypothetical protein